MCKLIVFGPLNKTDRAVNSAGECHPHTVEVVGSNPTPPTTLIKSRGYHVYGAPLFCDKIAIIFTTNSRQKRQKWKPADIAEIHQYETTWEVTSR